jgi:cellulose synthase (UDP-forming)
VARERRQVRRAHRVSSQVPVALRLPEEGRTILCRTRDYSMSGLGVQIEAPIALTSGQVLEVVLSTGEREHAFKAKVTNLSEDYLGLTFQNLSLADEAALIQCTFARVDAWENWQEPYEADRALQGLEEIVRLGAFSYGAVMREGLRRGTARLGQWARPGAVRQKA